MRIGRASVFRSAASTRSSLTTPRACRSLVSVCFCRYLNERGQPRGQVGFRIPDLASLSPLSRSRSRSLKREPRASRVLTRVSSIVAFPASVATVIWTDCYMPSYEREGNDDDFSSPIPYVDLFKFLFIKRSRKV